MDQDRKSAVSKLEILKIQNKGLPKDVKSNLTALINTLKDGVPRNMDIEPYFKALENALNVKNPVIWKQIKEIRNSLTTDSTGNVGDETVAAAPSEQKTRAHGDTEMGFIVESFRAIIKILETNRDTEAFPKPDERQKESVGECYKYALKVARLCKERKRETTQLQVENKYLKLILDDLHKSIIVGEATLHMELKPPEDIKNDKLIIELTTNTRKIHIKFYELETELDYIHKTISQLTSSIVGDDRSNEPTQEKTNKFTATGRQPKRNPAKTFEQREQSSKIDKDIELVTSVWRDLKEKERNAENATEEIKCILSTMECLINHVRVLSEGNTEGDISSALDQIKSSVKKGSPANQFLTQAREIIGIQMEWKRESEYASHLFKALNERLASDGMQDTQISLKEPPIQMAPASSKNGKKGQKKQNDERPCTRHIEQLQNNFASASNVLKKLMNAEESIAERKCLLSTLKCLCNYVRDLCEGKTEAETSPTWDEIWSSIKKESSANQGLSHAKEILSHQMEWKREAEYASNILEQLNDFATNDGKDRQVILKEPVIPMAHDSRTDAKKDSKKQTDQPPRSRHVEQLQRNFSSASKVLKKQMDAENAVKERGCLLLAMDCLFKHSQDLSEGTTEGDILSTLDKIKSSINKESPANQGLSHAGAILNIHMEWKREVEYVACLLEELANVSQSTNNGDNSIILSHPENFRSLRDYKTKDGKKTESSRNKPMKSVQNEKLMRHYDNASYILKQMKEKEVLRTDLGKKTDEVEDLKVKLKKVQGQNIEIKNDADSLRTRLSEHAGALLTFENPSISNLSDPNRPKKLAEMYSELYDNKWTDAFANLAKEDPDISEKKIIGYLYDMLVDGYRFCEDVRQTQKSSLEDILFYPAGGMKTNQRRQKEEISTIFANHLSDAAKLSSNKSSVHVAKAFVMDEKTRDKYRKMIKLCETYIQECVQLCWLMQVQTPPVCLDLKTIQGQTFDKNCYKEYTKKGKKIAFVVWPALFLHENGPLLIKGVAQGQ